jgi:hypothetical protein
LYAFIINKEVQGPREQLIVIVVARFIYPDEGACPDSGGIGLKKYLHQPSPSTSIGTGLMNEATTNFPLRESLGALLKFEIIKEGSISLPLSF